MQSLGLSESPPKTENRLKSLLWPSIESGADVDYLGSQGYWICFAVAIVNLAVSLIAAHPIMAALSVLFYFLGGVGVRERDIYAAGMVFIVFVFQVVAPGPGILNLALAALLLANVRATWIASQWNPASPEASLPPRFGETLTDKLSDRLPLWLWPKVRVLYYVFSTIIFFLVLPGPLRIE